ncbi:MAG TPA: fasciclin domain-containing protein [Chitinophagaceae bacterium]|jgi:uncharacterized surface protein with fasciclin (FAS1) repeats|nr:fasciclin domain-containing protein [Chitinophagaceae bacterium]
MLFNIKKSRAFIGLGLLGLLTLQACNKEFEDIPAGPTPPQAGTGKTLQELITEDTTFSFLKRALDVAGTSVTGPLNSRALNLTVFAPDNEAFRRSGIPSAAVFGSPLLDTATTRSLVRYLIIPQALSTTGIPSATVTDGNLMPNFQYPSYLNPAPQLSPLLRLTTFPSRNGNQLYVNNIPVVAAPQQAANGIIYRTAAVAAPPSRSLYDIIVADTALDYLEAAIIRADSGRTTIAEQSIIEIAKSIGANLTVFAPTDNAFRMFLNGMGLPADESVIGMLPVNTVRGIVAYHVLTTRAFSVNMPTVLTPVKTFLNTVVPAHPGVTITTGFTGPFVTAFVVRGAGNQEDATVVAQDIHATNGVIHKINMVLLPQ